MLDSYDCVDPLHHFIYWQRTDVYGLNTDIHDISYCANLYSNVDASRISVDITDSYNLHIRSVHESDAAGNYECSAYRNILPPETHRLAILNVYEPTCPTSTSQLIKIGDGVSLTCSVLARREYDINASSLELNFTTTEDDNFAKFRCVATSETGV